MEIQPLGNRVLLVKSQNQDKTAGGIFIPGGDTADCLEMLVISCGNGRTLENGEVRAVEVCPGETVLIEKKTGIKVKTSSGEGLIVEESQILAKKVERPQ